MAAKIINNYLSRKHGIPVDPQPTLIERFESGRKPWGVTDTYPASLIPLPRGAVATAPAVTPQPTTN
jgi:hypothetical protein